MVPKVSPAETQHRRLRCIRTGLRVDRAIGPLDFVPLALAARLTGMARATTFRLADRGVLPVRRVRGTGCRVVQVLDAVRLARARGLTVDLSRPKITDTQEARCRARPGPT
jgi:hypothetical protein